MRIRDRIHTVSRRIKLNSRNTLLGEQPNHAIRVQIEEVLSQHRFYEQGIGFELHFPTIMLSLA